MNNQDIGKRGEEIASDFLKEKGYTIIETNFHKLEGEIDIIALDEKGKEYIFVEVKTRNNYKFGYPEEAVTMSKVKKIIRAAHYWLRKSKNEDSYWRIDVIAINLENNTAEIKHFKNITEGF